MCRCTAAGEPVVGADAPRSSTRSFGGSRTDFFGKLKMSVRCALLLCVTICTAGCARPAPVAQPRIASLPTVEYPLAIYETILDQFSTPGHTDYLVVEDVTQICYDFEHRHALFKDYFAALDPGFREAHRDCTSNGAVNFRVPTEKLAPQVAIRARSSLRRYKPSFQHPTIYLSRPGFSSDSTRIIVGAGYFCGPVCGGSSIFGFEKQGGTWRLVLRKSLFES
jgi:hypothetical protein